MPLGWFWDILMIFYPLLFKQSLNSGWQCLAVPCKIPSMDCFLLAWLTASTTQHFIPLSFVGCYSVSMSPHQKGCRTATQALHCASCPASLQGLQMVIPTQAGPHSSSAFPECWELRSEWPCFVTADAVNLDDCVEDMEQFLRMKEVGPEEPSLKPGEQQYSLPSPHHVIPCRILSSCCILPGSRHFLFWLSSPFLFQSLLFVLWNYSSDNSCRWLPGISSLMNSSVKVCFKYSYSEWMCRCHGIILSLVMRRILWMVQIFLQTDKLWNGFLRSVSPVWCSCLLGAQWILKAESPCSKAW